jgi:hypothetical protein
MKDKKIYTTQLQAGLGSIEETRMLLDLWQPGMNMTDLFQTVLESGFFPNVSAQRLRNLISQCFAPRYLVSKDYPAFILKKLKDDISSSAFSQILFLFTARANLILADFVKKVYWNRYLSGHETIRNDTSRAFVTEANNDGKMIKPWSESTIRRVSSYLTGCCADFSLLETGRKKVRKIIPFRIEQTTVAFLMYDLHFSGLANNSVIASSDWALFGVQKEDLRDEMKRLSLKGFFMFQSAGEAIRIEWQYKNWEELIHVITER